VSKNLYVGGLDEGVKEEELTKLFSEAGKVVNVKVITDRLTGQSRGFAFVEMSNKKGAKKAIEMFNGKKLKGKALVVNEARSQK